MGTFPKQNEGRITDRFFVRFNNRLTFVFCCTCCTSSFVFVFLFFNSLAKYLETRRLSFPRFFFLHDFALLKVLEHSLKMHTHFDAHAHHCFPGIRAIQAGTFDKTTDRTKPVLTQVHSTSNETLTLTKPVSGGVDFLPMVSRQIGVALRDVFHNAKKVLDFSGGEIPIRSMEVLLLLIPVSMLSHLLSVRGAR